MTPMWIRQITSSVPSVRLSHSRAPSPEGVNPDAGAWGMRDSSHGRLRRRVPDRRKGNPFPTECTATGARAAVAARSGSEVDPHGVLGGARLDRDGHGRPTPLVHLVEVALPVREAPRVVVDKKRREV